HERKLDRISGRVHRVGRSLAEARDSRYAQQHEAEKSHRKSKDISDTHGETSQGNGDRRTGRWSNVSRYHKRARNNITKTRFTKSLGLPRIPRLATSGSSTSRSELPRPSLPARRASRSHKCRRGSNPRRS